MQDQELFEYAVIRFVPRVEREEFINVGVVLYCAKKKYLDAKFDLQQSRLQAFNISADGIALDKHLEAFAGICKGSAKASPIAKLDLASRFRWLTATRSTILQSSKVHPGFCVDPVQKLQQLYSEMVVLPEERY